jgi:hypothetical protein
MITVLPLNETCIGVFIENFSRGRVIVIKYYLFPILDATVKNRPRPGYLAPCRSIRGFLWIKEEPHRDLGSGKRKCCYLSLKLK